MYSKENIQKEREKKNIQTNVFKGLPFKCMF